MLLRGRKRSSLLVHAPITLLFPHFSVFLHFLSYSYVPSFLSHFSFLFFLAIFLTCFSLLFLIAFFSLLLPSLCIAKAFLYCLLWWVLLFYLLTTFGLVWVPFPDHPLICRLPSHHYYLVLAMPHSIPKQKSFVLFPCSLWHSHPNKDWVFFLTNSYGIHLVIPAHLSLFWVVCHLGRTFLPKELEREPQNRVPPLLPIVRLYPLLSLTHDPLPLYWLNING